MGNEEMLVDEFGVVICEEQRTVLPTAPSQCRPWPKPNPMSMPKTQKLDT